MPEGPSILIAAEEMEFAIGKKVLSVEGNSREPIKNLKNQKLIDVGHWGKHLLLLFQKDSLKIHFMLWGSYSVNQPKENRKIRLQLNFSSGKIFFYACSVKFLQDDIENIYDWSADLLSPSWSEEQAVQKIKMQPRAMLCDVLMDQSIFSGLGNIIKNEVLFLQKLHPERLVQSLNSKKIRALVQEAHSYSWKFYYWKKNYELKKHWLIMRKKVCPRCLGLVTRRETGLKRRLSHYCQHCQK